MSVEREFGRNQKTKDKLDRMALERKKERKKEEKKSLGKDQAQQPIMNSHPTFLLPPYTL